MDLHHTVSPAVTPARSADLIMEELREASPLADARALAEAFTGVEVSTVAEAATAAAVTGSSFKSGKHDRKYGKELMHTKNMKPEIFRLRVGCGLACAVLLLMGGIGSSFAQNVQPRTFSSPAEASNALFEAAQKQDEAALEAILGAGKEVTSSSDEVEDQLEREQFSKKYQEMHRLVGEADGSTVLYIGAENWPFPIPLVAKNGSWYFDSQTGTEEIKFRRIGENEATAIQVCEEFAMTESEHNATKEDKTKANSEDQSTQFGLAACGVMYGVMCPLADAGKLRPKTTSAI